MQGKMESSLQLNEKLVMKHSSTRLIALKSLDGALIFVSGWMFEKQIIAKT